MAKDTEKLIRELSLVSFLMSEHRPVSALEIKRDVEGYSEMNDEAFARRFYADRAELESLGIQLNVEKPADGYFEAELYSLPPENYYLPAIEFSDGELAALQTALSLLDGSFAYAEPLRLALQQLTWGRPSPLNSPTQRSVAVAVTGEATSRELSQRLSKIETAISRRKRIEFSYYTIESDCEQKRSVDPYHLLYQGGEFYLVGYSRERDAVRIFRLSRIRSKVSYATKAEHDFQIPDDFDPRAYANRIDWQFGASSSTAQIWIAERISWLIERDFGRYGSMRPVKRSDNAPSKGLIFETDYSSARQLISWTLGLSENARILGPPELVAEGDKRVELLIKRHRERPNTAKVIQRVLQQKNTNGQPNVRGETPIRPERFARLVTLAGILIEAARHEHGITVEEVRTRLNLETEELVEDINVLNVVNFGGGSYVLYAEIKNGVIEVDPEPYGDSFARPARLLPLEAKALVAAIDLLGDHLPQGSLESARKKIINALGSDPADKGLQIAKPTGDDSQIAAKINAAISQQVMLEIQYYKLSEDEFSNRRVEPYAMINGRQGWYLVTYDPERSGMRHFRLDRIKKAAVTQQKFEPRSDVDPTADIEGWPLTGKLPASRAAKVWISAQRARWAQEDRTILEELADGSLVIELPFAGTQWLVREILKEAGDAVVLDPLDARAAVLKAASHLASNASAPTKGAKRTKVPV